MTKRRFKIGQMVRCYPSTERITEDRRRCLIIGMLPQNRGVFEYKIRGVDEPYEQVVKETELVNPLRRDKA